MRQSYIVFLLAGLLVTGCKSVTSTDSGGSDTASSFDTEMYGVEAAMDTMNKAYDELVDDQSTGEESFAVADSSVGGAVDAPTGEPNRPQIPFCGKPAIAQECQVADDGTSFKAKEYKSCLVRGTRLILRGAVKLDFSTNNCSLGNEGDQVNRNFRLAADHIFGGVLASSSVDHKNYLGEELGGGQLLTRGADLDGSDLPFAEEGDSIPTWSYEVLGKHVQIFGRRARKVADVSVSTEEPIGIAGFRPRSPNRLVDGGILKVDHNRAKYTARFTPVEVLYQADCRCPVSGILKASYTRGDAVKEGQVEFLGCGKIKVTRADGTEKERFVRACKRPSNRPDPGTEPAPAPNPEPEPES